MVCGIVYTIDYVRINCVYHLNCLQDGCCKTVLQYIFIMAKIFVVVVF